MTLLQITRILAHLVVVFVRPSKSQELSDKLVRVGNAIVSFALCQDLRTSLRDARYLMGGVETAAKAQRHLI